MLDQTDGILICNTADQEESHPIAVSPGKLFRHSFDIPAYCFDLRAMPPIGWACPRTDPGNRAEKGEDGALEGVKKGKNTLGEKSRRRS
jgi:hypothetical protein